MGKALENKLKKRTALLDSAYELFTTMGFTKTTIRDIASKAGVAKGTFYLYFKDKSDIRDALIRSKASHVLQMACKSRSLSAKIRMLSATAASGSIRSGYSPVCWKKVSKLLILWASFRPYTLSSSMHSSL